jgi:hypothetical protein
MHLNAHVDNELHPSMCLFLPNNLYSNVQFEYWIKIFLLLEHLCMAPFHLACVVGLYYLTFLLCCIWVIALQ